MCFIESEYIAPSSESLCEKTGKQIAGRVQISRHHVIHGGPKYTILSPIFRLVIPHSVVEKWVKKSANFDPLRKFFSGASKCFGGSHGVHKLDIMTHYHL